MLKASNFLPRTGIAINKFSDELQHSVPVESQETDALKAIQQFSYTAKREQSGGWRTTRSKVEDQKIKSFEVTMIKHSITFLMDNCVSENTNSSILQLQIRRRGVQISRERD